MLKKLFRSTDETAPRCTCKRPANADSANAQDFGVLHRQTDRATDKKVHRSWRDSIDNCFDMFALAYSRRVQTIRTGICVGRQSANDFFDIRQPDEKTFGATD